jgi:hypothetical protein
MRSIVDMHHRVFPYFTKEWVRFMPVVLGNLLPLVDALPPVTPLSSVYNLQYPPDPSLPYELRKLVTAHTEFIHFDHHYCFFMTRFRVELHSIRHALGPVGNYPPGLALSEEEQSAMASAYGPLVARYDLAFGQAQQCYTLRYTAFDHITESFFGGVCPSLGRYGIAEYEVFHELWLRYSPVVLYPV